MSGCHDHSLEDEALVESHAPPASPAPKATKVGETHCVDHVPEPQPVEGVGSLIQTD